jgi:hypothetical protein
VAFLSDEAEPLTAWIDQTKSESEPVRLGPLIPLRFVPSPFGAKYCSATAWRSSFASFRVIVKLRTTASGARYLMCAITAITLRPKPYACFAP